MSRDPDISLAASEASVLSRSDRKFIRRLALETLRLRPGDTVRYAFEFGIQREGTVVFVDDREIVVRDAMGRRFVFGGKESDRPGVWLEDLTGAKAFLERVTTESTENRT